MASSDMSMWIQGRDQYGSICQRHKISGTVKYPPSSAGLSPGLNPNVYQSIEFFPDSKFVADIWEEHFDLSTNKPYWYNTVTSKSTWDDPKVGVVKPPPPPPLPPSPPSPPSLPETTRSKAELWSRKGPSGLWHHEVTGETQVDIPACRMKYKK